MKTCGQCIHFRPARNPETGRVLPSKPGRCGWPVSAVWPMIYCDCHMVLLVLARWNPCSESIAEKCATFSSLKPEKPATETLETVI